ncbi:MAG: ferredoxin--NADP(+) reductase [Rhodospirillaceae bacterium]|nr:ferredoxin--NADP(+) reductase [Rhodospirillaceae bacterium]|tara:strand:- start:14555 stop:15574 length:1020 start_codon:yes stop_codon:yes gene_type:complete
MVAQHETDIVVIGAGPVGLFQIFEAGMLDMRCHVVDTLDAIGGQCTALYPEKPIYDIPGYPEIEADDLIRQLEKQAAPFEPVFHLDQQVVALEGEAGAMTVRTSVGTEVACKAVVIAAGCGAFGPNRPPLAGIEDYEGSGSVAYLVTRKEEHRGKRVVIAGGGDSALDWVLGLHGVASEIMVVHRRDRFRAAPDSVKRMNALVEAGEVELIVPYQLHGLDGSNGELSAVIVVDLDGNERRLEADLLLPFYGLRMELGPIADWGLNLEKNLITVEPSTCETSTPGIYGVGDIVTYPGKLKLILSGFSETAVAAHAMYNLVYPDKPLHFEYSTTRGVPGEE